MINLDNYLVGASPYDGAYAVKYSNGDVSLEVDYPAIGTSTSDIQHTVLEGETLQNIAYRYYGDSGLWYRIALANNILNPFAELEHGKIIIIPAYG